MASKVTADNIIDFNKRYYACHNYSQVARETGFSTSTIRKYIDKNWKPIDETKRKIFDPRNLSDDFDTSIFILVDFLRFFHQIGTLVTIPASSYFGVSHKNKNASSLESKRGANISPLESHEAINVLFFATFLIEEISTANLSIESLYSFSAYFNG